MFNNNKVFTPHRSNLFKPYQLKGQLVKNRIMRSAMTETMANIDGTITEDLIKFYRQAAEGGVGLIITGAMSVHYRGRFFDQQIGAHEDDHIPGLKKLVATVHGYGNGAVIWAQLHSMGAHDWGYSYGQKKEALGLDCLTEEDIMTIIRSFGESALRIKKAGFDGVQLHGGHGYLIAQFLSPATNFRTDKWGGNPENRMRFILEILSEIRKKVGEDFPVGIKMNTADYLAKGNWLNETAFYAKRFADAGFDLIEASGGMGYMTELREALRKKAGNQEAYFRDAIPIFKEAVGDKALALVGGIRTPEIMEEILNEGVDFISMARPFLAEPDLPKRIKEGDIRTSKCVSGYTLCNLCLTKLTLGNINCVRFFPGDCVNACPIKQDNPNIFTLVALGEYEEALKLVKKDNPLANILSRVCHRPCETICSGEDGEPLAIRDLKRFITDYGLSKNLMLKANSKAGIGCEKVAIIGSGPAGLVCAYYLAQSGYLPTIFEKLPKIGGMISSGVQAYKLPEAIKQADYTFVKSAGVNIQTNSELGRDFSISDLFSQDYKAVFLAMGIPKAIEMNLGGSKIEGVIQGLDLLKYQNLNEPLKIGKQVVVIGGGNVAVDSARVALRLGAELVQLVCLEARQEMPAFISEINDALEEGVVLHDSWGLKNIKGSKKVTGVNLVRCTKAYNDQGQLDPKYDNSKMKTIDADTLIIAIGQTTDLKCIENEPELEIEPPGFIKVNKATLETNYPGVFAGGDVISGPKSIVDAAASGKLAAESIDKFIRGVNLGMSLQDSYNPYVKVTRKSAFVDPSGRIKKEDSLRQFPSKISHEKQKKCFEETLDHLSEGQAVKESKRCLKYVLELNEKSIKRMADMGKATFVLEE